MFLTLTPLSGAYSLGEILFSPPAEDQGRSSKPSGRLILKTAAPAAHLAAKPYSGGGK